MAHKRIMLDLETLDSASHAAIVSIGAVEFDEHNLGRTFYRVVNGQDGVARFARTYSDRTLTWWAKQSAEARAVLNDPKALAYDEALHQFFEFCGGDLGDPEMWGNGSDFDCVVLGNSFAAAGIKKPWSYGKNRCFRTLKNIVKPKEPLPKREGTHHNALDDAIYQARCAQVYLRSLA